MKIYLILLVISGICHLIHYLEVSVIIKEYELKRIKKTCIEEKILAGTKTLILWALILPNILALIANFFAHEAYEEGICNALEESEYWG